MFNILERYIIKIIINRIILTLLLLISLSGIIKFVEQLRKIGQGKYSILSAGLFITFSIPKDIEIFFPIATLLGILLALEALHTTNELVVMQILNFNYLKIVYAAIKVAIPLLLITIALGEWVVPMGEQAAYNYRTKMIYGNLMLPKRNKLWIKDGDNFIFIQSVINRCKLIGVHIYDFDKNNRLKLFLYAVSAIYNHGNWILLKVHESKFINFNQINTKLFLNKKWKTNLTPNRLDLITLDPNSLSILELYHYINYLKQNKERINCYQLNMWKKIFSPITIIVMLLMGLSFIFGPLYNFSIKKRLIIGISISLIFYIFNQVIGLFSIVYNISPIFGAICPSVIFFIISIIMLMNCK